MKKLLVPLLVLTLVSVHLMAQSLSEEELKSIESQKGSITFENYVGPATEISTIEEIRGIGLYLAVSDGDDVFWGNKYRIVRSFQPEISEGLDADILIILPDAGVDHIDNLRRIISAYIENTFDYSKSDSDVLAEFVTYYNAVYYKNMNHFSSRYKEGVLVHLDSSNAGLSTHYSEWAGKSRVVIPLKSEKGTLESSLDTSSISDPEVIEEMQKEDDKALDTRREMVEIREEELDEKQEEIDKEQTRLDQEKAELEAKEDSLEETLEEKKEELDDSEPGSAEEEKIQQEIEELEDEKEQIEEKKTEIDEKQDDLDDRQTEFAREEEEIVEMRQEIAKDENELAREEGIVVSSGSEEEPVGYWFIKVDKSADPASYGSLLKVTDEGEIIQRSGLNSVRGTQLTENANGLIVIAGKNEERSRVKAMLLDKSSLEILKEGEDDIYPGSGIWTKGNELFMISRNDQNWTLGKFSESLELLELSSEKLHPDTGLVFVNDRILVQSENGAVVALDGDDLQKIEKSE